MSFIAVISSIVILILGGLVLIYGEGYNFDLRKQKGRLSGGRRANDR